MSSDPFSGNSHKSRQAKKAKPEPEAKNLERIVQAEVIRRKPPLSRRMARIFFGGEDSKTVWGYVTQEVLVPAAKDTIADAVSQGVERLIFGEARRPRGRGANRNGPYISYSGMSKSRSGRSPSREREERRPDISRRARASHDFDEILLESRAEAEEVIERLFDLVSRYEVATVADLYELVGITGNYTDDKWGWYDLRSSSVRYTRYGYLLDLPRPEPLN